MKLPKNLLKKLLSKELHTNKFHFLMKHNSIVKVTPQTSFRLNALVIPKWWLSFSLFSRMMTSWRRASSGQAKRFRGHHNTRSEGGFGTAGRDIFAASKNCFVSFHGDRQKAWREKVPEAHWWLFCKTRNCSSRGEDWKNAPRKLMPRCRASAILVFYWKLKKFPHNYKRYFFFGKRRFR